MGEDRKKMRPPFRTSAPGTEGEAEGVMESFYSEEGSFSDPGMEIGQPDTEDIYRAYLEEIAAIKACDEAENKRLIEEIRKGNRDARNRIVEGNLRRALVFVQDYLNRGVPMADLIQEAGMELTLLADEFEAGDFAAQMEERIRERLEDVLDEQKRETDAAEAILARVNVLQEVSKRMAEELGREATLEELSERMKMPREEVREIMKVTMNALSLSEANRELEGGGI